MSALMVDMVIGRSAQDPVIVADDIAFDRFAQGRHLTSPNPYIGAAEMR